MDYSVPFKIFKPFTSNVQVYLWPKQEPAQLNVYTLKQVHGNCIKTITNNSVPNAVGDGAITSCHNIPLAVRFADCQNFVLYEPTIPVIGVIHAGWQGLGNGVINTWFTVLQKEFNGNPQQVLVAGGPSLCTNCAEFSNPTAELPFALPQHVQGKKADLQAIAKQQFLAAGVQTKNIEQSTVCTKCNREQWHSYRGSNNVKNNPLLRNYTTIELLS